MNDLKTVKWAVNEGVARLTLNRPDKRNALDPQMLTEILALLTPLRRDRSVNVVVITGEGKLFSAGVDLTTPFFMENVETDSVFEGKRWLDWQHEMIQTIHDMPQVTIAMMNGNAVGGGGLGMAMACDMRFTVADARFWAIPMALGVVQDFGLSWFMRHAVGEPRAMEIFMGGEPISAKDAELWGLVNRTFATQEELRAHVDRLSATIARGQPDAVRALKHVVRNGFTSPLSQQLQTEAIANSLCFSSDEFKTAKQRYQDSLRNRGVRK
jgi:enoyl-CoA hydratase/carnithine racemase